KDWTPAFAGVTVESVFRTCRSFINLQGPMASKKAVRQGARTGKGRGVLLYVEPFPGEAQRRITAFCEAIDERRFP
ncbi:MAG: hypothetical protein ABIJ95_05095, partial [Pseudomonadota bacterium]